MIVMSSCCTRLLGALTAVMVALHFAMAVGSTASADEAAGPKQVEVGIWFSGLHGIDYEDGSFSAEFYIWWISPDPEFRPFEALQVLNARQWTARAVSRRQLPTGSYHTSGILSVTVNHAWQLRDYPFDRPHLEIVIETSSTASELKFIPDRKESVISEFMQVAGFKIRGLTLNERIENYNTNFGIGEGMGNQFSRLIIGLDLERESGRLIATTLIGFIVANIISLLTYPVDISNLGIRVAMAGGAIFGAVGNMYSLNSALNPASGSLLIDRFAIGSFTMIIVSLLTAIVGERLIRRDQSRLAHSFNRLTFILAVVGAVAYYGLAVFWAINGST